MVAKKKKVALTTACKDGKHVFIVTAWYTRAGQQKASTVRCQSCLMPLDMEEMEAQEWNQENNINQ